MTTQSNIDLNTCVPGQKVRLRNGDIVEYDRLRSCSQPYDHQVNGRLYVNDGFYWKNRSQSPEDVVEILPMESTSRIDLNTCVPGQKVRLRDGTIATYNGVIDGNETYTFMFSTL